MLEKFNEQQVELITNCAEAVHSIETYRINQRGINSLFGLKSGKRLRNGQRH